MRGYHTYQNVWTAAVGDQLPCRRERANSEDPFAVAVMKGKRIVGQVPRKISCLFDVSAPRRVDLLSSYWFQALFRRSTSSGIRSSMCATLPRERERCCKGQEARHGSSPPDG